MSEKNYIGTAIKANYHVLNYIVCCNICTYK